MSFNGAMYHVCHISGIYTYDLFCDYNLTEVLPEPASTGEGMLCSSEVHKTIHLLVEGCRVSLAPGMLLVCF